jgi:cytidyltransferase-like protein
MENYIVKSTDAKTNNQYALFIGRWQPFHEGHQWLINQQFEKVKNVCIAIRDVEKDEKNWWSCEEIKEMLEHRFEKEIKTGRIKLITIPNIESINIGRGVGYDIIEHIPPQEIHDISATKIREKLKSK